MHRAKSSEVYERRKQYINAETQIIHRLQQAPWESTDGQPDISCEKMKQTSIGDIPLSAFTDFIEEAKQMLTQAFNATAPENPTILLPPYRVQFRRINKVLQLYARQELEPSFPIVKEYVKNQRLLKGRHNQR